MDAKENLTHWESWGCKYGTDLNATSKCKTIKALEIDTLATMFHKYLSPASQRILEIGCGNGINLLSLAPMFPSYSFHGIDFSPIMIESALKLQSAIETQKTCKAVSFEIADARQLGTGTSAQYDAIFTDRMLINLASENEQFEIMRNIESILRPGGYFFMLENSLANRTRQNKLRESVELPSREVPEFNVFINDSLIKRFKSIMNLIEETDVSYLHDLMLYVLEPLATDRQIHYDSPLMTRLVEVMQSLRENEVPLPSGFGQNILWVWKKATQPSLKNT